MTHRLFKSVAALTLALPLISACSAKPDPQDAFFDALSTLCGKSYSGALVSDDAVDSDFKSAKMVMHVRDCSAQEIRIPFHVDENRSRTWIITRVDGGLRLKHDHRHDDGAPDAVTMYGGDTAQVGTAAQQNFPVDRFSIDMFNREGLTASVTNIWTVGVTPGKTFAYQMARENRTFRVEFDLSETVQTPPAAWGAP